MPDINNGKLVYSLYEDGGYKIAIINNLQILSDDVVGYIEPSIINSTNLEIPDNLNLHQNSQVYSTDMSQLHIVPRIMFDYLNQNMTLTGLANATKYGFYAFSDDIIGQLSLFSGFSVNPISVTTTTDFSENV